MYSEIQNLEMHQINAICTPIACHEVNPARARTRRAAPAPETDAEGECPSKKTHLRSSINKSYG